MCRIKTFFCACELRSGAITATILTGIAVLAYLSMGGVLLFLALIPSDVKRDADTRHSYGFIRGHAPPDRYETFNVEHTDLRREYDKFGTEFGDPRRYVEELLEEVKIAYLVFGGYCVFNGVFLVVMFICILVGVTQEKARCVMVWLVMEIIQIFLSCTFAICCIFFAHYGYGIFSLASNAFAIYLWIIVFNYHHELDDFCQSVANTDEPNANDIKAIT